MPSNKAKDGNTIQIYPETNKLNEIKSKLPTFEPVDVTNLLKLPPAEAKVQIRRLTSFGMEAQLHDLLDALRIDRSAPDVWKRGFQLLAMIHHGAGHFFHKPRRRGNRNLSLTSKRDRLLHEYVSRREKEGKTRSEALRLLAADDSICEQLGLLQNSRSQKPDRVLRLDALRKRMVRIEKRAPPVGLLAAVAGDYPIFGSKKDEVMWFKTFESPPLPASGKSTSSKKA